MKRKTIYLSLHCSLIRNKGATIESKRSQIDKREKRSEYSIWTKDMQKQNKEPAIFSIEIT